MVCMGTVGGLGGVGGGGGLGADLEASGGSCSSVGVSGPGAAALAVVPLVVTLLSFTLEQPVL